MYVWSMYFRQVLQSAAISSGTTSTSGITVSCSFVAPGPRAIERPARKSPPRLHHIGQSCTGSSGTRHHQCCAAHSTLFGLDVDHSFHHGHDLRHGLGFLFHLVKPSVHLLDLHAFSQWLSQQLPPSSSPTRLRSTPTHLLTQPRKRASDLSRKLREAKVGSTPHLPACYSN